MKSNEPQIENEAQGDKTEELWNSGKSITNMLRQVTISRKQSRKFLLRLKVKHTYPHIYTKIALSRFVTTSIINSKTC